LSSKVLDEKVDITTTRAGIGAPQRGRCVSVAVPKKSHRPDVVHLEAKLSDVKTSLKWVHVLAGHPVLFSCIIGATTTTTSSSSSSSGSSDSSNNSSAGAAAGAADFGFVFLVESGRRSTWCRPCSDAGNVQSWPLE
jgi:hypothetical protein